MPMCQNKKGKLKTLPFLELEQLGHFGGASGLLNFLQTTCAKCVVKQ